MYHAKNIKQNITITSYIINNYLTIRINSKIINPAQNSYIVIQET